MGSMVTTVTHFNPGEFDRGGKYEINLIPNRESGVDGLTILLARGCRAGATLVAMAGVHGDEFEGVRAILERINL